jgi:hypothetical protein
MAKDWQRFSNEADEHGLSTGAAGSGRTPQGVKAFRRSEYTPGGQRIAGSTLGEFKDGYESKNAARHAAIQAAQDQKAIYG